MHALGWASDASVRNFRACSVYICMARKAGCKHYQQTKCLAAILL